MESSKRMSYFNELAVDLNDEAFFHQKYMKEQKITPIPVPLIHAIHVMIHLTNTQISFPLKFFPR